jgi:hypothetical protein
MRRATWSAVGVLAAVAAGCGGGTGAAGDGASAGGHFVAVEAPGKAVKVVDFLADVKANAGRLALTGTVYQVDAANSRFLLCDLSERECIGGT